MNARLEAKLAALRRRIARKELSKELIGAGVGTPEFVEETPELRFLWALLGDESTVADKMVADESPDLVIESWLEEVQGCFGETGEIWLSPMVPIGAWCKLRVDPDRPWLSKLWHASTEKNFILFDPLLDRAVLVYDGDDDYRSKLITRPIGKRPPSDLVGDQL